MKDIFVKKYVEEIKQNLINIDPSIDSDKLEKFIYENYIDKNDKLAERKINLVNNYKKTENVISLKKIIDYYYNKKPILTAFGTMFYSHEKRGNLNADFINYLMDTRKYHKKLQFEGQNEHDKAKEAYHKKNQKTWKVLNNSYYGVTGMSSSQFYNLLVSQSITYMGYAIITTSIIAFERFMANNYKYTKFNDLLVFLKDCRDTSKNILKYIDKENVKDKEFIFDYIKKLITFELDDNQSLIIKNYLNTLNTDELNSIYFKNNLYEFLNNKYFKNKIQPMLKLEIINPNTDIDETTKEELHGIWLLLKQYVYYSRQLFGRESFVPDMKRKIILGCDTDSNFVSIDSWFKWVEANLVYEKTDKIDFTITNIMVSILSYFIQEALDELTKNCNVPENKQKIINMKSEFLFDKVIYTRNKKQYISLISLKEGNIVSPPEIDLKGINIKKATVSNKTKQFFLKLIKDNFLVKDIDTSKILKKLEKFEDYIRNSLESGNIEFTTPAKLNDIESYKFPYRMQVVRGSILWNHIYPDRVITTPTKVNLLKLNAKNLEDLKPLYETEYYKKIKTLIFDKNEKGEENELAQYGVTCICLPKSVKTIPEWVIPLIDYDNIIDDNIRNINILINSLGLILMEYNNKETYSNFVNL